jgi:hypothetical protein
LKQLDGIREWFYKIILKLRKMLFFI